MTLRLFLGLCILLGGKGNCYADEDNNFRRIQLNYNCSLEIPISWKVITSANQDLDEITQAARDNLSGLFKEELGGSTQTEFFAYKIDFKKSRASVCVQFNGGTNVTQKQIKELTATDRGLVCDKVRSVFMQTKHVSNCTVKIMKHNDIYAIINKYVDDKGYQQINVQVPISEKALAVTFDTLLSDIDDWRDIFLKIMNSI